MSNALSSLIADYGLVALFALSMLESACVPIPSEVVVPLAGFFAFQQALSLPAVVIVATLANVAGSWAAYEVGLHGGRPLIERYGRYLLLNQRHLDQADHWFARHGEITVFISRMLPAFRTFISLPAGVARMPLGRFLLYSLLGALPWNLALALAGYQFGAHWPTIYGYLKPLSYLAILLLVGVAGWFWFGQRARRRG